jgi:hypothetical protein
MPIKGEMSEWLKEHAWKVCIRETVSRVRIPLSPQIIEIVPSKSWVLFFQRHGQMLRLRLAEGKIKAASNASGRLKLFKPPLLGITVS